MNTFDLDRYCERTGAPGSGAATLDRLTELQRAQAFTIPFENFDIQLGRGVNLEPGHVFAKLVCSRRGGYCFELNSLLLRALQAAGFSARALLGRVHVSGEPSGRSHHIGLVEADGRQWIADAGFGGMCPRAPLLLEHGVEQDQDGWVFRLVDSALGQLLQLRGPQGWIDLYSFDLTPVVDGDITYGNHFTSTHPQSFFTTSRIASIAIDGGRLALFNFEVSSLGTGDDARTTLADDASYLTGLQTHFGIELDADYQALRTLA